MTYPEGSSEGTMILRNKTKECICPIETQSIQLKQIRETPDKTIKEDYHVVALLKEMEDYDREHFKVLHLDTKNRVIGIETASVGILNASLVHPREILKGAILNNANAVIFVHNHPSGNCEPSQDDAEVLDALEKAFQQVGIKVLDNIIIGKECYHSKTCQRCSMAQIHLTKGE